MDNLISLYRGLPGNRQFNGIQGLPYFVFNPLRNLLFTKEDISAETQNEPLLGDSFIPSDNNVQGCPDGQVWTCTNNTCSCRAFLNLKKNIQ
jgi:hypothetical protein